MALLIVVFVVELIVAASIYLFLRKCFSRKFLVGLAVCASLLGLIAGWIAGYRATGYEVTMAHLTRTSEQLQRDRGKPLTLNEEHNLKNALFAKTEFTYLLHKKAATHAVPAFLLVLIIMIRRSKKQEKQYINSI
jgi:hypothetical protein